MKKEDLIRKLTSRKFWAMVAEFVTALMIFLHAEENTAQAVGSLIMLAIAPVAYMFAESMADAGRAEETPDKPPEYD